MNPARLGTNYTWKKNKKYTDETKLTNKKSDWPLWNSSQPLNAFSFQKDHR